MINTDAFRLVRELGFRLMTVSIVVAVGFVTHTVHAQEVLDQEHTFVSGIGTTVTGTSVEAGETFTVGVAGTLSRIEVFINRINSPPVFFPATADVVLTVYDTSSGLPNNVLGSVNLVANDVPINTPDFVSFDVSSFNILVTPGEVLAFGITSEGDSATGLYNLPVQTSGTYSDGSVINRVLNVPPDPWQAVPGEDFSFRTFVIIPEPTTVALLTLAAVPLLLRRQPSLE